MIFYSILTNIDLRAQFKSGKRVSYEILFSIQKFAHLILDKVRQKLISRQDFLRCLQQYHGYSRTQQRFHLQRCHFVLHVVYHLIWRAPTLPFRAYIGQKARKCSIKRLLSAKSVLRAVL